MTRACFLLTVVLGIVLDLSALGIAETDDPSLAPAVNERDVVQTVAHGDQSHHSDFVVRESVVNPDEGVIPDQLPGDREGQAVTLDIETVLVPVEDDPHA
jgi:hypothetical protein